MLAILREKMDRGCDHLDRALMMQGSSCCTSLSVFGVVLVARRAAGEHRLAVP